MATSGQGNQTPDPATVPGLLSEARIENNREQAAYYRTKTAALTSDSAKNAFQRLFELKCVMQWLGHAIAFASVILALVATFMSNRELKAARENADFYESLKRMGDKDSPMLRASAAELLSLKAAENQYYEPARSQLLHAFLLEDDPVVLGAIQDASDRLIDLRPSDILPRLEIIRPKLQVQLLEALAPLTLDETGEIPDAISVHQWELIEAAVPQTDFVVDDFQAMIDARKRTFLSFQLSASSELKGMSETERAAAMNKSLDNLRTVALRLELVENLLESRNKAKD